MNTGDKRKLKVLFITEFLPWPLTSGGRIRSYHILRQISLRHEVTLVTTCSGNEKETEHFEEFVSHLHVIRLQNKSSFMKALGALSLLLSDKPYLFVYSHFRKEMAVKIKHLIDTNTFDLIHIDHLDAAAYFSECGSTPVYLDEHNFETKLLRSLLNNTSKIFLKYYLKQQNEKLARFEANALKQSDGVGAVSDDDANLMAEIIPRDKIEIIPNGVDLDFFNIERTPRPWHLVSIGSLDWPPNVEGLIWFLDKVWPGICEQCPGSTLNIVGRNPPKSLLQRANDNVSIAGSVPDVREYAKNASAFIVPLFSGGGTRLKVLEAMAMRIPLISTPIGVEGIECENGKDVLIAENAEEFCNKVVEILGDTKLADQLAEKAHKLVEERYGWSAICDKLDNVYRSIATQ